LPCAWQKFAIKCSRKTWFPRATCTISNAMLWSYSSKLTYIVVVNLQIDVGGDVIMCAGGGGACTHLWTK
jgi:hypothetical protein